MLNEDWGETLFSALSKVGGKYFSKMDVGYDNVDVNTTTKYGVAAGNTPVNLDADSMFGDKSANSQDCKDFHPPKDGDGWVEQSSQPLLFGMFQKVDAPRAYVCADSKICDATEWYICQGMRCPANTHKPSFNVNTSVMSKHSNNSKGASSSRNVNGNGNRNGNGMPNMEESMTEEEFMEWLQNAVQSGMFDNFAANGSGSDATSKTNGGGAGNNSNSSKRKKKGKKW